MENPRKRPSIRTTKNLIVVFSVVITTSSLVAGRWNWSAGNRKLAPCLIWRISGGESLFCVKKWSFFHIARQSEYDLLWQKRCYLWLSAKKTLLRGKKAKKTKVTLRFAQTMTASEKKKKKIPGKISFFLRVHVPWRV